MINSQTKTSLYKKIISITIAITFLCSIIFTPALQAQTVTGLPAPGTMILPSTSFIPPVLKGIKVFPDNPLKFDFIIDTGHAPLKEEGVKIESTKLIKYFLAALTVPEDELWVNLSPYEQDRVIPEKLGVTEMGRDLLGQDYILKQLTASMIYPEDELGKKFWERVYAKAARLHGTTDIPVNTFNKVWVIPESATVHQSGDVAFIVDSRLKVMLEEDYIAIQHNVGTGLAPVLDDDPRRADARSAPTAILREVILPEIEKEVNTGKHFMALRQIYHSMVLATWFKQNLKQSLLGKIYIAKNKISGVDIEDKQMKEKIYQQYLEAFKKGVYSYIKEEYDTATQQMIPKKYFSGGYNFGDKAMVAAVRIEQIDSDILANEARQETDGRLETVSTVFNPVGLKDRAMLAEWPESSLTDEAQEHLATRVSVNGKKGGANDRHSPGRPGRADGGLRRDIYLASCRF
jgi:hypothetical protein